MKTLPIMVVKKKIVSMTKEMNEGDETFILKKRTDKEEVTKTLEKISNGWLLTVDKYPFNGEGEYSCVKKYFETNPLEMESEEEEDSKEEESDDKMEGGEFKENWDILSL
jgi:hypothetical protein